MEGFRHVPFPRIELCRNAKQKPFLYRDDSSIIAVASDRPLDSALPRLDLKQPRQMLQFILGFIVTTQSGARE